MADLRESMYNLALQKLKNYVSTATILIATKLGRVLKHHEGSHSYTQVTFLSGGLAILRDKLKPLYLHYHSAYGHQTYSYITFNQMVLLDPLTI